MVSEEGAYMGNGMTKVLGMDPGVNTGLAIFENGALLALATISPHQIEATLRQHQPSRVVFEDSRIESKTWTTVKTRAAALKMARNVGQIDAWCLLITELCKELGIECCGVSPKTKGAKLNAETFNAFTGWQAKTNEHCRDAAMVAWPYRKGGKRRV